MTLEHYKQKVKDYIKVNNNPQNWRLYNLINNPDIKVKRLLKDMEREGLITIHFENDNGKVRRILTNKNEIDYERLSTRRKNELGYSN
jgi:hypothetical protein